MSRIALIATACHAARLSRKLPLAFVAGALATLALPPLGVFPVLVLSFPVLLWLLGGSGGPGRAFLTAWCFGFGYFVFGLYWISFALFTDFAAWWWAYPFALLGLPFLLAFFSGMAGIAFHYCGALGAGRIPAFAVIWVFFEYLRGHLFTGFPWNLAGYVWADWLPMLQNAAFVGIYGLTLMTVALAALPAVLGFAEIREGQARRILISGAVVFMLMLAAGMARLSGAGDAAGVSVPLHVRIVQPNIPQTMKWDPALQAENFSRLLRLSALPVAEGMLSPDLIVWPETAAGFDLDADVQARDLMARVLSGRGIVVTGALRFEDGRVFNSIAGVDAHGQIAGWYDKFHLVPFGEYFPFRDMISIVPFAAQVSDVSDFSTGPGPRTVRMAGLPPFSPLVCYEVIFPGAVTDRRDRPDFLLNATNDGWYGRTAGPHQHFAIARTRAVEEGLPLIRAANTGISGVIDSFGRVVASGKLGDEGVVDALLPSPLSSTPYTKAGNAPYFILSVFMLLWAAYDRRNYTFA